MRNKMPFLAAVYFAILLFMPYAAHGLTISGDYVGIGTNSPSYLLDVQATGSDTAIMGLSFSGTGMYGYSISGYGISGYSSSSYGVYGESDSMTGVYGYSGSGSGVRGSSIGGTGVFGHSTSGDAGYFQGNVRVTGNQTVDGTMSAYSFTGRGSGLTEIPGGQVTGIVASATNSSTLGGQSASDIIAAASDEVRTPISSLPFDISTSGSYYLTGNQTSTGNGINVSADNVTMDFNGFKITGPGKTSGVGIGINMVGRTNVEIKNGTVTQFGYAGIQEYSGSLPGTGKRHRILNMRVTDNGGDGLYLAGSNFYISGNTVSGNGTAGIFAAGTGSIIIGNTVADNADNGLGVTTGCAVKNNTAYHNGHYGIQVGNESLVEGNVAISNNTAGGYANMDTCATCTMSLNHAP